MKMFFDINVILPRCFAAGGATTVQDFASEGRDFESRILTSAVNGEMELCSSVTALVTLRRKLMDSAVDSDPLDRDSAVQTATLYGALCTSTGGGYVSSDEVKAHYGRVQALVPAHLTGNMKGQIDHEDLTILAGCLANITEGETIVLLTNDQGSSTWPPTSPPAALPSAGPSRLSAASWLHDENAIAAVSRQPLSRSRGSDQNPAGRAQLEGPTARREAWTPPMSRALRYLEPRVPVGHRASDRSSTPALEAAES